MSTTNSTATEVSMEFVNTYLHFTIEAGTGAKPKPNRVTLLEGKNATLLLVESGQVRFYIDLDTAVSLGNALKTTAALA